MLKTYGYILSLLLIFSVSLEARSLLYKLNSHKSNIYILGSIHLAKPELYPLDKAIRRAYEKSEVLVVEIDPFTPESAVSMQEAMMKRGLYPEGKSLKTELSAKTYEILQAYTDKVGISLEPMERMKPWVVMLQLSMTEMMRLGYSPELGIDKHFLDKAKGEGKAVMELETAQEQMALLSRNDKDFQDRLLRYTLESMHEMEPLLERMFESWKRGDEKTFDAIISSPLHGDESLKDIYDALITRRNYKMTEKIEGFLQTKKNYFIVVGAGHLTGNEGIIALLRKKGYRVMQR